LKDWIIDGPRKIKRSSVVSTSYYENKINPLTINPIEGIMEQPE